MPAIALRNCTLGYERRPAVHHLTGGFAPGSLTAVMGPNGAGKSTLLKGIAGLLKPLEGSVDLGSLKRRDIAYLPQQAEIDRSFPITVLDTVLIGHWRRIGLFRGVTHALREEALAALSAVGLEGFDRRLIGSLSAGQFQRVLFARLLLQDCPVILLDEPFTAIDAKTTADLLELVHRWHGERRTVIAVLHDLEQVRTNFPETLLLARKPIAWGPTGEALRAENLFRARQMAEAWNETARPCALAEA